MRRYGRGQGRLWLPVLAGVLLAALLIHWFDLSLRPQLIALSQTQLQRQLTSIADDSVTRIFSQEGMAQEDMVRVRSGQDGPVAALSLDTRRLNLLRSALLEDIITQIEALDTHSLGVPLGTLTGLDLLSAMGPRLPVRVVSVASAQGSYRNEFTGAGINQTLHRVMLDVTVTARILLPGGIVEMELATPVCVAETLIVGQVPQTYLNWNGEGGSGG